MDLDLVQLLQAMAENPWVCIQHLDLASNSLTGTADAFLSELHWHLPLRQACVRVLAFASAHVWPSMSGLLSIVHLGGTPSQALQASGCLEMGQQLTGYFVYLWLWGCRGARSRSSPTGSAFGGTGPL